jgi:hypothetical protein
MISSRMHTSLQQPTPRPMKCRSPPSTSSDDVSYLTMIKKRHAENNFLLRELISTTKEIPSQLDLFFLSKCEKGVRPRHDSPLSKYGQARRTVLLIHHHHRLGSHKVGIWSASNSGMQCD